MPTCPFCGAEEEQSTNIRWTCGTRRGPGARRRSINCYGRQLAAQAATIAELETQLQALQRQLEGAFKTGIAEGIETAAQFFDNLEIHHFNNGATWDRTRIVEGSKYCVPTNGPAIVCVAAEAKAKEIRALKKAFHVSQPPEPLKETP